MQDTHLSLSHQFTRGLPQHSAFLFGLLQSCGHFFQLAVSGSCQLVAVGLGSRPGSLDGRHLVIQRPDAVLFLVHLTHEFIAFARQSSDFRFELSTSCLLGFQKTITLLQFYKDGQVSTELTVTQTVVLMYNIMCFTSAVKYSML